MVPRDDLEAAKEENRNLQHQMDEVEEKLQTKQRDYLAIVEAYNKVVGQAGLEATSTEARPLTPRPHWYHCRGLLDPDYQRTLDKAENSQEILQHMLVCSRTLLSAYGLSVAAAKSQVFQDHARHPQTLALAASDADSKFLNRIQDGIFGSDEDAEGGELIESKTGVLTSKTGALTETRRE